MEVLGTTLAAMQLALSREFGWRVQMTAERLPDSLEERLCSGGN